MTRFVQECAATEAGTGERTRRAGGSGGLQRGLRAAAALCAVLLVVYLGLAIPVDASGNAGHTSAAASDDEAALLDAARQRWSQMSPEQRERVRERYQQWRTLDPGVRMQVRENFRHLRASQEPVHDRTARVTRHSPELSPEVRKRIQRYAHDPVYRHEMRRLHADLGPQLQHDRELLHALHRLSREERRELLEEAREEQRRQRVEYMLELIDADEEQARAVHAILEDGTQEQQRVMTRLHQQRRELRHNARERISELLDPESARRILATDFDRQRPRAHDDTPQRTPRHRGR